MKISIKPYKIVKDPANQVTSSEVFKKNQRRVSNKYLYNDQGLFSRKIFGRIGSCECGERTEPGYCELCGTRVINPNDMPDFFIDLGVLVPKLFCEYGKYKDVKDILEFKSYLYVDDEGNNHIVEDNNDESEEVTENPKNIYIGLDAARIIHPDIDEWAEKYMTDYISIPHTTQRPNLKMDNGQINFSSINKSLINVLKQLERINKYKFIFDVEDKSEMNYYILSFYREVYEQYVTSMKEIFKIFSDGKTSFIGANLKGHRVTGAIKGTVVNRFDIDEDVVLIGDTFIQTLYPYLWSKYDGDLEKINNHFVDNNEVVLVNRPPTICHLSIAAMKPRVASCYRLGTFSDGALGKNSKSDYDDEIDTLGIRTVAINPIVTDGFAGDYDGDVLLVIALYSQKAKEEAYKMFPSDNYMNYPNGNIRNKIPEDIVFANTNTI